MPKLSVPEQHGLKIARSVMRNNCIGAVILGGMGPAPHILAINVILELTGKIVPIPEGCNCDERLLEWPRDLANR